MINVRSVPCWFEPAVINGPAKRLLLQIGGKKGAATTNMLFCLFISLSHSAYITFRIIMSFRKPCHMPFRKLIPSFTLTVEFQRKWTWIRRIIFLLWFAAVKLFWPVFKFDKIKRKEFKKDIMLIDVFIIQSFWCGKPEVILKLCNWCNFSTNLHLLNHNLPFCSVRCDRALNRWMNENSYLECCLSCKLLKFGATLASVTGENYLVLEDPVKAL